MERFICVTCGTQYPDSEAPPDECPICLDPRQYVPASGQRWTTLEELRARERERVPRRGHAGRRRHRAVVRDRPARAARPLRRLEPAVGLHHAARRRHRGRGRAPRRAGRDRDLAPALLLLHGRVGAPLRLPDPPARRRRRVGHATGRGDPPLGGRRARARPRADARARRRALPRRRDAAPRRGRRASCSPATSSRSSPTSRTSGSCGATPTWCRSPRPTVQAIAAAVEPFEFATIYGAWWDRIIPSGAKDVVMRSAERYGRALRGELSSTRAART